MRILPAALFAFAALSAQTLSSTYTKHEFRIPMRDGTRLYTSVYTPKDHSQSYPFLLQRTPYSCGPYGIDNYPQRLGPSEEFTRSGYIFVCQDVRGRNASEGVFDEMRPHSGTISESTDTYDTIDFLLKNVPHNNGRAGIIGTSYPGFYAAAAIPNAHPALKAASPQAPMIDLFRGDDSFHNGAFMLAANFGFYRFFVEQKEPSTQPARSTLFEIDTPNHYDFYLRMGPLANSDERFFKLRNPYWTANLKHTSFDEFWRARNLEPHIKNTTPAILAVGGWYDSEDPQGVFRLARAAQSNSPQSPVTLVVGPWTHGGWSRGNGDALGPIRFNALTGPFFREKLQFPFFEHFLKSKGEWKPAAAWLFMTGTNEWRRFDAWPPPSAPRRSLYLQPGGALAFTAPAEEGFDEYVSDPARPVPFTSTITSGVPQTYVIDDQRHAAARPDVLVYQTPPLDRDTTLAGPLSVRLFASTSGTDSDFVVKLIDVHPAADQDSQTLAGYQQLVRGEPFRGRFYKSFERPEPLPANQFVEIKFDMPDTLHTFRRGHRIMVQIQSSWFPLTDRNPQKFVPSIPDAKPADFIKATQRIARGGARASSIEVRVIE